MVIEKLISDLQAIQATHPGIDVVILNWKENLSGNAPNIPSLPKGLTPSKKGQTSMKN